MQIFNDLMSPLTKESCTVFYYLGIFSFIIAMFSIISLIISIFNYKKDKSPYMLIFIIMEIVRNLLMYYFSRIYYSMCLGSLN